MQKIRKKLADICGVPEGAVMDIPVITMQGNIRMNIENYKNIILFTDSELRILAKDMILSIYGRKLNIDIINSETLSVSGFFDKIEYKE